MPFALAVRTKSSLRISKRDERTIRDKMGDKANPRVKAGKTIEWTSSLPLTGNQPSQKEKTKIIKGPSQKMGMETPKMEIPMAK